MFSAESINTPVEIIPSVRVVFSETGIDPDVMNAWVPNSIAAGIGLFDRLKPVRHYADYFRDQGAKYEAAGQPGLFNAVMQKSNLETVVAFDKLVDEFNADLPRIVQSRDNEAVQVFFRRTDELKYKPVDTQDT